MKIPFSQINARLTGISTPLIGAQWEILPSDMDAALRLLTFLEDRRVLYSPYDLEVPDHCTMSVIQIRQRLTAEMERLDGASPLYDSLSAMRAACRKFLDRTQALDLDGPIGSKITMIPAWTFLSAMGELRGVFGVHIALIAVRYGIDVEEELATILPAEP